MYEEIDDGRTITARKDHRCEWCGEVIRKGESCIKRTYKWEDEFWDNRQHPECFEAMKRCPFADEGFCPGENPRGAFEGEEEEDELEPTRETA